jgi:hypothetical protein
VLCRYHHRLKTHAPGWTVGLDPDPDDDGGVLTWAPPTGTPVSTTAHDHRPDPWPEVPPF